MRNLFSKTVVRVQYTIYCGSIAVYVYTIWKKKRH